MKKIKRIKKIKQEKGITVLALIITVIVLLILAVVAIRAVQQSEIITHAKASNKKYSQAQLEEEVNLVLNEYTIAKHQAGTPELETFLKQKLGSDYTVETATYGTIKVRKSQYEVLVNKDETITPIDIKDIKVGTKNDDGSVNAVAKESTSNGTTLYITFTPTIENGEITKVEPAIPYAVTQNGTHEFNITGNSNGKEYSITAKITVNQYKYKLQRIEYNELAKGEKSYTVKGTESGTGTDQTLKTIDLDWRLMEITDDGKILIVPSRLITSTSNDNQTLTFKSSEAAYVNGPRVLDDLCNELYGKGNYAIRARSMNVDDLNRLSGFNPETVAPSENSNINDYLDEKEYGSIWKYRYKDGKAEYSMSTDKRATWTNWQDVPPNRIDKIKVPGATTWFDANNQGEEEFTFTAYRYQISSYLDFNKITQDLLAFNALDFSELLKLQNTMNKAQFWLADTWTYCDNVCASFGLRRVNENHACIVWMGNSTGGWIDEATTHHLCPVVEFDASQVNLTLSNKKWQITPKQ